MDLLDSILGDMNKTYGSVAKRKDPQQEEQERRARQMHERALERQKEERNAFREQCTQRLKEFAADQNLKHIVFAAEQDDVLMSITQETVEEFKDPPLVSRTVKPKHVDTGVECLLVDRIETQLSLLTPGALVVYKKDHVPEDVRDEDQNLYKQLDVQHQRQMAAARERNQKRKRQEFSASDAIDDSKVEALGVVKRDRRTVAEVYNELQAQKAKEREQEARWAAEDAAAAAGAAAAAAAATDTAAPGAPADSSSTRVSKETPDADTSGV